jgi:SAM-dependent methyltransferase
MQCQTGAKLRRGGLHVLHLQGRAQQLPFADASFGSVVATFPAEYIVDPASLAEFRRVLKPGGQLVVVGLVVFRANPVRPAQRSQAAVGVVWSRANRRIFGASPGSLMARFRARVDAAGLIAQVILRDDPPWQVPVVLAERRS